MFEKNASNGASVFNPVRVAKAARHTDQLSRYLVLGFSLGTSFERQENPPPYVVCSTGYHAAELVTLNMVKQSRPQARSVGQWRLCVEVDTAHSQVAPRVLNGFESLFTQLAHSRIDDLFLHLLPSKLIRHRTFVSTEAVEAARLTGEPWQHSSFEVALNSFYTVPDILTAFLFFQLPTVLQSDPLFAACSFFQASCNDFIFSGDVIAEIRRDNIRKAEYERDRIKLESVVIASFRAIEAILGEPGKEDRFRKRLALSGLSYDELVGFAGSTRKKLGDEIYALQRLRDSTSAHGSRKRREPVSWGEAMNAQTLAEAVIHQALWHECCRRGRPEGRDEEIRYLLLHMYPSLERTNWLDRSFKELDAMTPVDAIRLANGPSKVSALAERLALRRSQNGRKAKAQSRPDNRTKMQIDTRHCRFRV